jgi:hypothetical protein
MTKKNLCFTSLNLKDEAKSINYGNHIYTAVLMPYN